MRLLTRGRLPRDAGVILCVLLVLGSSAVHGIEQDATDPVVTEMGNNDGEDDTEDFVVSSISMLGDAERTTRQEAPVATTDHESMAAILDAHQAPFFREHGLTSSNEGEDEAVEIIIVLGFGKPTMKQHATGTALNVLLPSKASHFVNVAVDLALQRNAFLLFTGGYGEGILMASQALTILLEKTNVQQQQLHPMQVLAETASRTTPENAINTKTMLDQNPIFLQNKHLNITVLATDWHMPRALMIFRSVFDESPQYSIGPGHAVIWPQDASALKTKDFADQQSRFVQDNADLLHLLGYTAVADQEIRQAVLDIQAACGFVVGGTR